MLLSLLIKVCFLLQIGGLKPHPVPPGSTAPCEEGASDEFSACLNPPPSPERVHVNVEWAATGEGEN